LKTKQNENKSLSSERVNCETVSTTKWRSPFFLFKLESANRSSSSVAGFDDLLVELAADDAPVDVLPDDFDKESFFDDDDDDENKSSSSLLSLNFALPSTLGVDPANKSSSSLFVVAVGGFGLESPKMASSFRVCLAFALATPNKSSSSLSRSDDGLAAAADDDNLLLSLGGVFAFPESLLLLEGTGVGLSLNKSSLPNMSTDFGGWLLAGSEALGSSSGIGGRSGEVGEVESSKLMLEVKAAARLAFRL
jgi:hypothetical protein